MCVKRKQSPGRILKEEYRSNRKVFLVWSILRLFVILAMVLSALNRQYENVFLCLLVLLLFLMPSFVQHRLKIELPTGLQIAILFFIFAAEILGELACYYVQYPYWDTILHTTWGFLCSAFGFSLVDLLNKDNRTHFKMSPFYLAVCAFCFSMTIGVLWEFFEFSVDRLFMKDMQKDTLLTAFASVALDESGSNIPVTVSNITSTVINNGAVTLNGYLDIGLYDTMEDLFVNFIGALTFSVIGYFSARRGENSRLLNNLIPRLREEKADTETAQT